MKNRHLLLFLAALIILSSCNSATKHCFLCQSVPQNAPCIVNLSTGEIAALSLGGKGLISYSVVGGISITGQDGLSCVASLPIIGEEMNLALFCDDCKALISPIPNNGYVLADLHSFDNIQLYPIAAGERFSINQYDISIIADEESSRLMIEVIKED